MLPSCEEFATTRKCGRVAENFLRGIEIKSGETHRRKFVKQRREAAIYLDYLISQKFSHSGVEDGGLFSRGISTAHDGFQLSNGSKLQR